MRSLLVLLVLPACAFGPVRRVTVAPMKAYDEVKTIGAEPTPDLRPEYAPLESSLLAGVMAGLQKGGAGTTSTTPGGFRLRITLLDASEGSAIDNRNTVAAAANLLGIASETATRTGRLSFEAAGPTVRRLRVGARAAQRVAG